MGAPRSSSPGLRVREHFLEKRQAAVSQEREKKKRSPRPEDRPRDGLEGRGNTIYREIIIFKGHRNLDCKGDMVSNGARVTGSNQALWAMRRWPDSEDSQGNRDAEEEGPGLGVRLEESWVGCEE